MLHVLVHLHLTMNGKKLRDQGLLTIDVSMPILWEILCIGLLMEDKENLLSLISVFYLVIHDLFL